ncbi:recombinase family protein [Methylobacterium tarhaniae]|uniref:recombinase family protein n=1 Tax=Methylobacterium tarhaniae TaxID=1187852 RepID=UPI0009F8E01C|nr:recombinase family protein [Methylobacterium tarhaniae]
MEKYPDRFALKGRQASLLTRQESARLRALELAPIFAEVQADGATTLSAIATALNARGVPTARSGSWSAAQVQRVLTRIGG